MLSLGKECIPEEFGPREKVPIEEGVIKNEHLISGSGGLHLRHQQAVPVGCTYVNTKKAMVALVEIHGLLD